MIMKNFNLAMLAIKSAMLSDAPLAAWCQSTFGKPLTILLGNRSPDLIEPSQYPLLMLVAQNSEPNADDMNISIGFGLFHDDFNQALSELGQMQELVFNALFNTSVFSARFNQIHPDGEMFHPKHHMVFDISAFDFIADITSMNDFITFHADSQIDADPEPELISEETLPV